MLVMHRALGQLALAALLAIALGACTEESGGPASTPDSAVASIEGPFLDEDALQVVLEARWLESVLPRVERVKLLESEGPIPLEARADSQLLFAIPGGGCPPTLEVGLQEPPPDTVLTFEFGEPIPLAGEQCTDILMLWEFELDLVSAQEPEGVEFVVLSSVE